MSCLGMGAGEVFIADGVLVGETRRMDICDDS